MRFDGRVHSRPGRHPARVVVIASLTVLTLADAAVARAIDPQPAVANEQTRQGQTQRTRSDPSSRNHPARPRDAKDRSRPASLDLSPSAIRKAIKDSMDPLDDVHAERAGTFGGGRPSGQARIDQAYRDAEIPSCLTQDAYKFDPPHLGPIWLGGMLALPFFAHAFATGKCRH